VDRIRVVVSGMPRMLREMVTALVQAQADMAVVGAASSDAELHPLALRTAPDVVILAVDDDGVPAAGRELVYREPHVKLIAVAAAGRQAWLYELRPVERPLGEMSPEVLVETIRAAAGSAAAPRLPAAAGAPLVTEAEQA
jgi:DNA-binding NarL/FixJ family response regulator